jgi:hypothetical protein
VALIVEIATSNPAWDLGEMLRLMWSPQGEAYGERREVKFGERIEAATIEKLAVATTVIN